MSLIRLKLYGIYTSSALTQDTWLVVVAPVNYLPEQETGRNFNKHKFKYINFNVCAVSWNLFGPLLPPEMLKQSKLAGQIRLKKYSTFILLGIFPLRFFPWLRQWCRKGFILKATQTADLLQFSGQIVLEDLCGSVWDLKMIRYLKYLAWTNRKLRCLNILKYCNWSLLCN